MVKAVSFFKRRAGMDVEEFQAYWRTRHPEVVTKLSGVGRYVQSHTRPVEEFQRYWRDTHGPLAAAVPNIRRYVQSHTRLAAYDRGHEPAWDGIAILWLDDLAALRAAAATPEWGRVRADEANFLALGPASFIVTTEHVIVD